MSMPASEDFNPSILWVYKRDNKILKIVGDFVIFVDNVRVTRHLVEIASNVVGNYLLYFKL